MCNCDHAQRGTQHAGGTPTTLTIEAARVKMPTAERAVMCWVCPHARAADRRGGLVAWASRLRRNDARWCAGEGWDGDASPLVQRLADGRCPRERFVPGDRTIRWIGLDWIGLPMPLRWLAWALGAASVRPGGWWGCGCARVLREAWDATLVAISER